MAVKIEPHSNGYDQYLIKLDLIFLDHVTKFSSIIENINKLQINNAETRKHTGNGPFLKKNLLSKELFTIIKYQLEKGTLETYFMRSD